jgi:hypothetical protein
MCALCLGHVRSDGLLRVGEAIMDARPGAGKGLTYNTNEISVLADERRLSSVTVEFSRVHRAMRKIMRMAMGRRAISRATCITSIDIVHLQNPHGVRRVR